VNAFADVNCSLTRRVWVASERVEVAICFVNGDKYADVEFLNTGEIVGATKRYR